MRQAARITLFVLDKNGRLDTTPDLAVLHALLEQVPLVNRNPDGSRTLVFDLADPATQLDKLPRPAGPDPERLRGQIAALASEARALGLNLTAALADSAELVAEAELAGIPAPRARD